MHVTGRLKMATVKPIKNPPSFIVVRILIGLVFCSLFYEIIYLSTVLLQKYGQEDLKKIAT